MVPHLYTHEERKIYIGLDHSRRNWWIWLLPVTIVAIKCDRICSEGDMVW